MKIPIRYFFLFSVEQSVFKSKFVGWDDVLAVDFTKTADRVSQMNQVDPLFDVSVFIVLLCGAVTSRTLYLLGNFFEKA